MCVKLNADVRFVCSSNFDNQSFYVLAVKTEMSFVLRAYSSFCRLNLLKLILSVNCLVVYSWRESESKFYYIFFTIS